MSLNPSYLIADWEDHYESSATKRVERLSWVKIPNATGDTYYHLMEQHGARGLGVWVALVQAASRAHISKRDGSIYSSRATLVRRSGVPAEDFDAVIPTLLEMGWLQQLTPDPDQIRIGSGSDPDQIRDKDREIDREKGERPSRSRLVPAEKFDEKQRRTVAAIRESGIPSWENDHRVTPEWLTNAMASAPGRNYPVEVRACAAWWLANPAKTANRKGCTGTLGKWFKRANEDPGYDWRFGSVDEEIAWLQEQQSRGLE